MIDPRRLLSISSFYSAFQAGIAGTAREQYVRDYLRPEPGMRLLDIGCGPGDILDFLDPSIDYTGVDQDAGYIARAQKRFGDRGRFLNETVATLAVREPKSFDRVTANGVLHHLTDDEARKLLDVARQALKPDGWFVSIDGCWERGQSIVARALLACDRGEHIRQRTEYLSLVREYFPRADYVVRHDLMRMPYTHLIMRCPRTVEIASECDSLARTRRVSEGIPR